MITHDDDRVPRAERNECIRHGICPECSTALTLRPAPDDEHTAGCHICAWSATAPTVLGAVRAYVDACYYNRPPGGDEEGLQ